MTEQIFQALKPTLTSSPFLRNPGFQEPIIVHTDALDMGLDAVLSHDFDGEEQSFVFESRKLTPFQQCYAAME